MNKKVIFLFIGRTASGKSSLARYMCKNFGFKQVKSYTTRPPRDGEINGYEDHYFVSEKEFSEIKSNKELVAYTKINGYEYGTTLDELEKSDIYVIDPDGVKYLKEHCSGFKFVEIYFSSPFEIAKSRYIRRDGDEKSFYNRYNSEDEQFSKYEQDAEYDHLFVNDMKFSKAASALCDLMKSEIEKEQQ